MRHLLLSALCVLAHGASMPLQGSGGSGGSYSSGGSNGPAPYSSLGGPNGPPPTTTTTTALVVDESADPDLPCLECGLCGGIASLGGARYLPTEYQQVPGGGWEVPRCECPGGYPPVSSH